MKKSLTLLLFALPLPAIAQDRIGWTNGEFTDPLRTRVTEFTAFRVLYTVRGGRQEAVADTVVSIEVERARDAYRRGLTATDPGQVLAVAREKVAEGDKFIAQFGFQIAAEMFLSAGQQGEGFTTLDELKTAIPDSGFLPDCYRMKIEYHLAQGKPGGGPAAVIADQYSNQVTTTGMPQGFGFEADYYKALADFTSGTMDAQGVERALNNLLVKVSAPNPSLANRIRLGIANSQRLQGRSDDAEQMFEALIEGDAVDVDTRAGALLGLGHLAFEKPGANPDNFREALLRFLRVYVEAKEANDNVVAEALHFAAESANGWKGADYQFMNARLRRILTTEYAHTPWGKPK